MSKKDVFREQKEKLIEAEESLSVDMASGLFELKDLVNELRDIRDSDYNAKFLIHGHPNIYAGDFNQSLRRLEEALSACLHEYKRMDALKNLSDYMSMSVLEKFSTEIKEKALKNFKRVEAAQALREVKKKEENE